MNELLEFIINKKIWIYGAGYVAVQFWEALKKHGLAEQIQGFLVSTSSESRQCIGGLFTKSINQMIIDDDTVICIAVHEVYKNEIELILNKRGVVNYIWVYPFLYELHLGMPIETEIWIETQKLIPKYDSQYGIAVRWAAIDNYYGGCPNGFDLYKMAMAMHTNMDTAVARTRRFKELIQNWDAFGYQDITQISINQVFDILDGEHRVALAFYHKQDKLKCRIYDGKNIHGKKTLMTKKMLLESGFTREEVGQLDKINKNIKNIIW